MCMAFAATALAPSVRPPAVAEETKAEMARYGAVFSRGQSPVDSNWSAMGLTYKSPLELYHVITAINGVVGGME